MHLYAKFDPNIPCGSRVMNIFPTDGQTHIVHFIKRSNFTLVLFIHQIFETSF